MSKRNSMNLIDIKNRLNRGEELTRNESITLATAFFNALPENYFTAGLLEKANKLITSKKNVSVLNIKVTPDTNGEDHSVEKFVSTIEITRFAECPVSEGFIDEGGSRKILLTKADGEKELSVVENFSSCVANFQLHEKFAEKLVGHTNLWYCPSNGYIYVLQKSTGATEGLKKTKRQREAEAKREKVYINLLNNTESKGLPVGCICFSLITGLVTPSAQRTGKFYLMKDDGEDYRSYVSFLTKNVSDAFTSTNDVFKSLSKMSKFFTRAGIAVTGQKYLLELHTFAYVEKIGDFNEGYTNCADGEFVVSAKVLKQAMKLKNYKEALRELLQGRMTEKVLGKIKFAGTCGIEEILERMEAEGIRIVIVSTKKNPTFKDVQAILDGNGLKIMDLSFDNDVVEITKPISVNLISIGKLTEGRFNKQILESYEIFGAKKEKLTDLEDLLVSQFESMLTRRLNEIKKRDKHNPSLMCNFSNDLIKSLVPTSPFALTVEETQQVSSLGEIVDKMGLPLFDNKGRCCIWNMVAVVDRGLYYGKRILQDGEVFLGAFSHRLSELEDKYGIDSDEYKEYLEYIARADIFKSPKMKPDEFYSAKVISTNEIVKRIEESDYFTDKEKKALIKDYRNMADSAIIMPGLESIIDRLADMDFDMDKNIVVLPNQFLPLEVIKGEDKYDVIDTEAPRKKVGKIKEIKEHILDARNRYFFFTNYLYAVSQQDSIGKITNDNNIIIAIRSELLRGNLDSALLLMEELFGEEGANDEYVIDDSRIDMNFVDNMFEIMGNCKWTKENMDKFLVDCSKVFRLYQGGAIDAVKTGIYLDRILTVRTIKALSLVKVRVVNDSLVRAEVKKTVKVPVDTLVNGEVKTEWVEKPIFLVNDFIGVVQNKLIDIVNKDFKGKIEQMKKARKWSSDVISQLSKLYGVNQRRYPLQIAELRILSSAYLAVAKAYGKALANVDTTDDKEAQAMRDAITETFRSKVSAIIGAANRIMATINEDDKTKGAIAMAVAMWRAGSKNQVPGINASSQNKFAITCFPKEVFNFLLNSNEDLVTCEDKILKAPTVKLPNGKYENKYQDGDVVAVSMGLSEDGLLLSKPYTGLVEISGDSVLVEKSFEEFKIKAKDKTKSRLLIIDKAKIDKKVADFITNIEENSIFVKNCDGLWYSQVDDFVDICDSDEVLLCDAEEDENYSITRVYTSKVYYQGVKASYVIELEELA